MLGGQRNGFPKPILGFLQGCPEGQIGEDYGNYHRRTYVRIQ